MYIQNSKLYIYYVYVGEWTDSATKVLLDKYETYMSLVKGYVGANIKRYRAYSANIFFTTASEKPL